MKKAIMGLATVAVVVFATMNYVNAGDEPWMDAKNCDFCANMMSQEGLMKNMTWEQHKISNGLMSVTTVKPEYLDSFKSAMAGMEKTSAAMKAGEKVSACNMCKEMGAILMGGANKENVETKNGMVCLMTSSDAEMVTKIQAWGTKTTDEMMKMHKMMSKDKGESHEGHNH